MTARMKRAIIVGALAAVIGCGGASTQGASGKTAAGHAQGECPHCKNKGGQGCPHCNNPGMQHHGEKGTHEHGAHEHGDHAHGGHDHAHGGHDHAHGGPLVHRFEKADDWAKEFDNPERDAWQKPAEVVAAVNLSPGMTVADIGAGTGYFEPHLSKAVGPKGSVLAVDIEADMVRYLRERAVKEKLTNVTALQAQPGGTGLADGSVDRILIVDTWHHIPERAGYVQQLKKALKPGGMVIVVDFTLEAKKGPPPAHRLAPEEVIAELEAAGFAGKAIDESLPEQYIVVAKLK
jgi:predicted O-methyltransferase YrrM